MSTPSKRRKQARAWMHAERERHEREVCEREAAARRRADADWQRRLTLVVPSNDEGDTFYPQGKLERPFVRVYAPDRRHLRIFDPKSPEYYMRENVDIIDLRAKQMALVLPNGAKAVWWTWEMAR